VGLVGGGDCGRWAGLGGGADAGVDLWRGQCGDLSAAARERAFGRDDRGGGWGTGFPRGFCGLSKTVPCGWPPLTRFGTIYPHGGHHSLRASVRGLCGPRKKPHQTSTLCPLLPLVVGRPTRLWKACTRAACSVHADSVPLSTLPRTTTTTTGTIYPFTLFLRSLLPGWKLAGWLAGAGGPYQTRRRVQCRDLSAAAQGRAFGRDDSRGGVGCSAVVFCGGDCGGGLGGEPGANAGANAGISPLRRKGAPSVEMTVVGVLGGGCGRWWVLGGCWVAAGCALAAVRWWVLGALCRWRTIHNGHTHNRHPEIHRAVRSHKRTRTP
jgi:hypothetical protein